MVAAITAAGQGAEVTILERNDRVGKKLLATGNGKCNLGNFALSPQAYYGGDGKWIESCLQRFTTQDTIAFFRSLGLLLKDKGGYLYPISEQASVVLDVLRIELQHLGVHVITGCKINRVQIRKEDGRILAASEEREYAFDSVIIACGGKAAPKTGSDGSGFKLARQLGHNITATVPALVQLKCREDYLKGVAGVRADAAISILQNEQVIARERGELQLTDYGISGIAVFQLSRIVNYILREEKQVEVMINLLPDYNSEDYELLQKSRELLSSDRTVEEYFTGLLNKKLMQLFVKMAGLKGDMPLCEANPKQLQMVYDYCRDWRMQIIGSNSYEQAQVCAGGVALSQVSLQMESLKAPGVFFAGEVLDVDGKCGGYNLQWAWCSGYLAGMEASKIDPN